MRKFLSCLLLMVVAFAPGLVLAHEGHDHVMGKVTAVDATHLELTTKDGKTVSVALTPDTRIMKAGAAVAAADLKVGARVVIDTETNGEALQAKQITIGTGGYSHKKN
jgi:hypothetical protein